MVTPHKRGFTLIELLVVIAIIGLLSSVILGSLNLARTKAKDTVIVQSFHSLKTNVENEIVSSGSYLGACDQQAVVNQLNGMDSNYGGGDVFSGGDFDGKRYQCYDFADFYVVVLKLSETSFHCFDSRNDGAIAKLATLPGNASLGNCN